MKKLLLFYFCILTSVAVFAQRDTLPKFSAVKKNGEIVISWLNSFKVVSQINIQRSKDSTKNFSTIHSLSNPNVKTYSYVDKTAKNDSGFYRIFILFEGSAYIFTPSKRLLIDTSKVVITVLSEKEKPKEKPKEEKPQPPPKPVWIPSVYVFTGDDGNPVIKLPDADTKKYSIKFMLENGNEIFLIPEIKQNHLILDKVNFLKSGWYYFEIIENGKLKEKNKLLVTRDN